MKSERPVRPNRRRNRLQTSCSPIGLGLEPGRYEAVVSYLFDRPAPQGADQAWYWNVELEPFEATPLEWTRLQTAIFHNAATDLACFSDEQLGMGLNYLMSNSVSDVPYAAIDPAVPLDEAMRMMRAMPTLWRDCIGPRLAADQSPIGSSKGTLDYVCYMWFDVWPTYSIARGIAAWTDAVWDVLRQMLAVPCRAVQIAALHGMGHLGSDLDRWQDIDAAVDGLIRSLPIHDRALRDYAEAARTGNVQ